MKLINTGNTSGIHLPKQQYSAGIIAVILFAAMIFSPRAVFSGAEEGLLLWFQIVFPTLFPFMLISSLMLEGGGLGIIAGIFGKVLGKYSPRRKTGLLQCSAVSYAVIPWAQK